MKWPFVPKLKLTNCDTTFNLFQEALILYGKSISTADVDKELQHLEMDDLDLVEAIQLVENVTGAKFDTSIIRPTTKIIQILEQFDKTRFLNSRCKQA
jgi:hypothetical protein